MPTLSSSIRTAIGYSSSFEFVSMMSMFFELSDGFVQVLWLCVVGFAGYCC